MGGCERQLSTRSRRSDRLALTVPDQPPPETHSTLGDNAGQHLLQSKLQEALLSSMRTET